MREDPQSSNKHIDSSFLLTLSGPCLSKVRVINGVEQIEIASCIEYFQYPNRNFPISISLNKLINCSEH